MIGSELSSSTPEAPPSAKGDAPILVIEPSTGWRGIDFRELWHYRELLFFLAWRDVLVRYKQTTIGIAWALVRPLATMVVLTVVFGKLAHLDAGQEPYALLVLAAMLPWQFFAAAISDSSGSVVANANLITKVYFPRLIIPASAIIGGLVDFLISGTLLAGMLAWYGWWPGWRLLTLPVFALLALVAALGAGLWLSALTVRYRDFRVVVPFLVQFGLYASPVGFNSNIIPAGWRLLYSLNPMVGVIDGFRWAILGARTANIELDPAGLTISAIVALTLFISGAWYFHQVERGFSDIV